MKFKVGDKVRVKKDLVGGEQYNGMTFAMEMEEFRGKTFTVGCADTFFEVYLLENVGWYFNDEMLEPVVESKIIDQPMEKLVVYRDGDKTIARYYKGDKVVTASTTCCSCDNYDFKQGVALTTESVFNKMEEEEVGYSWVKCVGYRTTDNFNFTIDKKYKIYDNGRIIDDSGFVFHNMKTKKDMLDFLSEFFIFEEVDK